MKMKKIPMRTCVVTREKCEKKDLVRVVRTPEGEGSYLKLSAEVIQKARKNKALDRTLEVEVPESVYEELESLLNK